MPCLPTHTPTHRVSSGHPRSAPGSGDEEADGGGGGGGGDASPSKAAVKGASKKPSPANKKQAK